MQLPIKHKSTDKYSANPSEQRTQLTVQENIDFLTRLYLKVPALSFEVLEHYYPSAGHAEAYEFGVYHGIDLVGKINFRYRRTKNGETVWATSVQSPYIRKDRAPHHEFISTNPSTALRKAIEVYSLGPNETSVRGSILFKAKSSLDSLVGNAMYKARRPFSHNLSDADTIEVLQYFIDKIETPTADIAIPKFATAINTDDNKQALNNYTILKGLEDAMKKNKGYAVRIERDESIRAFPFDSIDSGKQVIHAKTTYELPEWMQSKLAMLKMLDGVQAVSQVGVRLTKKDEKEEPLLFFIVDGEMTFDH